MARAQVVSTFYNRHREDRVEIAERGDEIEVTAAELKAGVEAGTLRAPSDSPLPPPNWKAAEEAGIPTTPAGEPIDEDEVDGGFQEPGAAADDWKEPRTHADADAQLSELGFAAPAGAKVGDKVALIRQIRDARAAGEETPTGEHLEDLSDDELRERAVAAGHAAEEVEGLEHDALVLFVAEAVNRRSADPAEQAAAAADAAEE